MSLAPCPRCTRHVRSTEAACPFCGEVFLGALEATGKHVHGVSRAMLVFGSVVAMAAASEGCSEPRASVSIYGAPPALEDAAPNAEPAASDTPKPAAVQASDSGAKPFAPAAAYGAPPSFLPPPTDVPKQVPKKKP